MEGFSAGEGHSHIFILSHGRSGSKEKNWRQLGSRGGGASVLPAYTRRVAWGVREFLESSRQDGSLEGEEMGLGHSGVQSDGVATNWLQAGRRKGLVPPASGRRRRNWGSHLWGLQYPFSLRDSKWPILECLQEWGLHPFHNSDPNKPWTQTYLSRVRYSSVPRAHRRGAGAWTPG